MEIGSRIKALREARGLTLEQVGDFVGVNKATIQRYEIGNIDIKRNVAIKLAECLGTSPSYIMGWTDDPLAGVTSAAPAALSPRLQALADALDQLNEEGQKVPVRSLDGFYDFKYSSVTSRSRRDSLGGYIALDIETAGLKATDAILEVSAVLFSDFVPQSIFTSLVRPSGPIPAAATKVNGITDDMVVSAPYFWQILPSLQAFVGNRPLVGHNLSFDLKFLYRRGFDVQPKQKLYDTLEISQRHLKRANDSGTNDWDVLDHKLETVCKYYGIYIDGAHRSASDAFATGLLFARLVEDRTRP